MLWSKIYSFTFLLLGFFTVYLAVVLSISTYSENKWEKSGTFFPSVQAQINFYQDRFGTKTYSSSWSSFWSSPEYYNQSFTDVKVTLWNEPTPVPSTIGEIITTITRNSH